MSVIFAMIHDDFIAMSADKQATNRLTSESGSELVTKIHLWSPHIGVGFGGNAFLGERIKEIIYDTIIENIEEYELEEIADLVPAVYQDLRDTYDFVTDEGLAKCIFAGTLSSGKLGLIDATVGGGCDPVITVYTPKTNPVVLVSPPDLPFDECVQLFHKAIRNTVNKKTRNLDVYEASYRKAIRYVSEHSNFVGYKSDYIVIRPK